MKHSCSWSTSLPLAIAILSIVCCSLQCSAFKVGQETTAATIISASYEVHEPEGGYVGWRPPPRPKTPCRSSYPDYGREDALVPPPAAAIKDGHETQDGENGGAGVGGGDRKGWKPPSPWGRPGYGHR